MVNGDFSFRTADVRSPIANSSNTRTLLVGDLRLLTQKVIVKNADAATKKFVARKNSAVAAWGIPKWKAFAAAAVTCRVGGLTRAVLQEAVSLETSDESWH